ncbi:hypothetical protein SAMN06265219_103190 [Gracilimonas mengyeensis]|uniref:TonB dependent receptor n=2 Tax=Gracilimonas mengyeensis TaxID=1302730 RepID=A0A521BXF7_9BACT|nr:hypothetical protein SAMN06265219_103190 [Gracilimonas mengyeensis]
MKSTPLFTSLFVLLLPVLVFAQDGQGGNQGSLLPEINPQDIEIRSEFQASFPGLRRQPILGFNPKPRVYQVDPNRMPFMESREDAVADISITQLGRPEPPTRSLLSYPARTNGYLRAGFGSYITPMIEAYGYHAFNENRGLTGNLNVRSSEGHLSDDQGGFRYMDFNARYFEKINEKWRFSVDVKAQADQNFMFYPENTAPGFNETPEKEYLGAYGKMTVQKINNAFSGMKYSLGGSIFDTELTAKSASVPLRALSGELNEKAYFAGFKIYWPGNRQYETFDVSGGIKGGTYDLSSAPNEDWMLLNADFTYERLFNFTTRVNGKAGVAYVSDAFSDKVYFSPEVEITHYLAQGLQLQGRAYATPEVQSVQDYHEFNRFLNTNTQLRHTYTLGAEAEAQFQLIEGNRIFGGVRYQHAQNFAYYQRDSILSGIRFNTFYDVNYGDANIFELYAGASHQLVPNKFWADAKVYARSPKLSSGGNIPYEERLGLEAGVSFRPVKELTINSWAEYIGKRRAPAENGDLDAFFLLSAGAEYQINDTFGVFGKMLNILDNEYAVWSGYPERPLQIFGGLTVKF